MGRCLQMLRVFICIHTLFSSVNRTTGQTPEEFDARLRDGSRDSEGRVEVFYNGKWGTVCDNLWTIQEANVLCKQLGYAGADEVVIAGHFGEGAGDITLDMVQCENGDEANLFECMHSNIGSTTCTHSEDVGVVCTSTGSLRLEHGTYLSGRLELLDGTQGWGTVCNEGWDTPERMIACKQLGFQSSVSDVDPHSPGTGPMVLGGLQCRGPEYRLDECNKDPEWMADTCTHAQDVMVKCKSPLDLPTTIDNPVFKKPVVYYGRTEGTFCPDNWNINAARVFCKGTYPGHVDVLRISLEEADPQNPPNIIVNTIDCAGDEEKFADCTEVEWAYAGDCRLDVHPVVECQNTNKDVILQLEDFPEYGRVEVRVNYMSPLSICMRTWTQGAADVVCRDLGFERGAKRFFPIGGGSGDLVFDNIHCTGNEQSFDECQSEVVETSSDCNHNNDVGVECIANDITLINFLSGAGTSEGVVKYRVEDRWAWMCDATWTDTEAAAACRMAGYEGGTATAVVDLTSEDFTDVFQWDIQCNGNEERLEDCTVTKTDNPTTCAPVDIAQVTCGPNSVPDTMRMVGSAEPEQGRLEYYTGDEWVSVWVDRDRENTAANIWDGFCETMGYEKELYHYYNDDGQMPFDQDTEGARRVCNAQCLTLPSGSASDYQPLGLVCKPFEMVANHPIRLVDIETGEIANKTGVVEIYNDGEWGNICQDDDYYPAESVCSELGFENTANSKNLYQDGRVTSKKWFSLVMGRGYDQCSKLYECPHTAWGHFMDECIPLTVTCAGGSASSLEGLALSLIIMVVIVSIDLVFTDA